MFVSLFLGWLGALSMAVALFISPVTIAVCKSKSTRLTAVIGGLVTALGCLFTSFASQFHQLFLSYGEIDIICFLIFQLITLVSTKKDVKFLTFHSSS
jgi:ABC-type Mn2+/Zn2+ transport system permease subunit